MKKENVMKKISDIILTIFGVGITVCLFAGGITLLGFIVAMCIGGDVATQICVFIHKTYFPIVIQFASVFTGLGLLGMYLTKKRALTVSAEKQDEQTQDTVEQTLEKDGEEATVDVAEANGAEEAETPAETVEEETNA